MAWLSTDSIGERYLCFTKPKDSDSARPLVFGDTAPQPAPPADSVMEDAERYRFLAEHCRSTSEHWGGRWSIVVEGPAPESHNSEDDFDAAIDAAMNKGGAA